MQLLLFTYFSITLTIVSQRQTTAARIDYCEIGNKYCRNGHKHIACNNYGAWDNRCPSNRRIIHLPEGIRNLLTKMHNVRRNFVAGGGLQRYNKACRMTTMSWSIELAKLAEMNVKQCEMIHDECHNTKRFQYSGQNLSKWQYYDDTSLVQFLHTAVKQWFTEHKVCHQSYIDNYPPHYSGDAIGHFTSMVHERNTHLGCAVSTWTEGQGYYKATFFLLACNYATTNYYEFPIYESCRIAGAKCTTGRNTQYKNLCSEKEFPKINIWIKNGVQYF